MKKLLLIALCSFSLHFFGRSGPLHEITSSSSGFDSLEVFVSITVDDKAVYTQVKNTLSAVPGVNYFSYCDNHAVFLVYIDQNTYASTDLFKEQLRKSIPEFASRISLKSGVTFKDFVASCNSSDAGDAAAIKNSFGK